MDNIREVCFLRRQSGEDLYFCKANNRVYSRQPSNGEGKIVFWYSTVKWDGGYEANCPIKEGMTFVISIGGKEYRETLVRDDWNSGTSALKVAPFSWELEHADGRAG